MLSAPTAIDPAAQKAVEARLAQIPRRLERLRKTGLKKRSLTDPDSRFLRQRQGFTLGYTATMAVSEDHLIVEQRVTQEATDNASLLPVVEAVEQRCGETPRKVSADSGFFSLENVRGLEARGIEGYIPDANLAHELKGQGRRRRAAWSRSDAAATAPGSRWRTSVPSSPYPRPWAPTGSFRPSPSPIRWETPGCR